MPKPDTRRAGYAGYSSCSCGTTKELDSFEISDQFVINTFARRAPLTEFLSDCTGITKNDDKCR